MKLLFIREVLPQILPSMLVEKRHFGGINLGLRICKGGSGGSSVSHPEGRYPERNVMGVGWWETELS